MVPLDSIPEVHRELETKDQYLRILERALEETYLVVEVMITLAVSHERCDHMVAGSVFVVKWCFSQPVCKRVDTKCRLEDIGLDTSEVLAIQSHAHDG